MVVYASCSLASATRVSAGARSTSAGRSGCSRRASRTRARICSVLRPVPQMTSGSTAGDGQRGGERFRRVEHRAQQRLGGAAGAEGRVGGDQERSETAGLVGRVGAVVQRGRLHVLDSNGRIGLDRGGVVGRRRAEQGVQRVGAGSPRLGHAGQPHHPVAAAALGVVEDAVGGGEQRPPVVATGRRGDTDADRDGEGKAQLVPVVGGDLAARALEGPLRLLRGRVGQQDDVLVTGPAAHLVGRHGRRRSAALRRSAAPRPRPGGRSRR